MKKTLLLIMFALFLCLPIFASDNQISVIIIFNNNKMESISVIYPQIVPTDQLKKDINTLSNNIIGRTITTGMLNQPINGKDISSFSILTMKAPYKVGKGRILKLILESFKRFNKINMKIVGDFNYAKEPLLEYQNNTLTFSGKKTESGLLYNISIHEHNFDNIKLPTNSDNFWKEKAKKNNIFLVCTLILCVLSVIIILTGKLKKKKIT